MRRRKGLLPRLLSSISRWTQNARLRWRTSEKYIWVAVPATAMVVTTFWLLLDSVHDRKIDQQSLSCLALNVYFEARGEPEAGRYAVAEVTMNRVASRRYPDTVCGVVYQKNWDVLRQRYVSAFSWTEFETRPKPSGAQWVSARDIAEAVYFGRNEPRLVGVTHYHSRYIRPSWSRDRTPVARIGNHVFYR